jgi:hypothetical protein
MKCGFCDKEFSPEEGKPEDPCGRCLGKCQKRYCPYCGYGNPLVPGYLRKWGKGKKPKERGDE